MSAKADAVRSSRRLSGQVVRYHTWPTLTSQSTGEHTWQVLRIWWEIFGPMTPAVSSYIIFHDSSELRTGDITFNAKRAHPALKAAADDAEAKEMPVLMHPHMVPSVLTPLDYKRFKVCDNMDMHEFGRHEVFLGNSYGEAIVEDTLAAIHDLRRLLPEDEQERIHNYLRRLTP